MMRFTTASGSVYEISDEPSGARIRRVNQSAEKRADGDWVRLINDPSIEVGERAFLVLDSLTQYGQDDIGTDPEDVSPYTFRTTSKVTEVEYVA